MGQHHPAGEQAYKSQRGNEFRCKVVDFNAPAAALSPPSALSTETAVTSAAQHLLLCVLVCQTRPLKHACLQELL